MTTLIKVPFAQSGDKTAVPITDPAGGVNWTQGYGSAYAKDPATDPSAKRIERELMNGLFNQISTAVSEIQTGGFSPYISAADNGGSPVAYPLGACVMFNNIPWQNLKANNTGEPSIANSWVAMGGPMIGEIFYWTNGNLPVYPGAVFMKCNASTFTAAQYPIYALLNPTLKTPELRGEFIRVWDDGRGVDPGRSVGQSQADAMRALKGNIGNFQLFPNQVVTPGVLSIQPVSQSQGITPAAPGTGNGTANVNLDTTNYVPTADEFRPRNIAINVVTRVG